MIKPTTLSSALTQLPYIKHGFFGRKGGVSEGLYTSLNVGLGSSDNRSKVIENRQRIASAFHHDATLLTLHQIHSANVVPVSKPWPDDQMPKADAMVTDQPNIILGILTADCVPVLFADKKKQIIGAAHAGWKGAIAGVLEQTLEAMRDLGADHIMAAIGPCIQQHSYEVDTAFQTHFLDDNSENTAFFTHSRDGHYQFDLAGYVKMRLEDAHVSHVVTRKHDTYTQEADYFSYRRACHRNEPDYGRHLSGIMLTRDQS